MTAIISSVNLRFEENTPWQDNEDEHQFWPRVVWFDPGVSTGCTVLWFNPEMLLRSDNPPVGRAILGWWTRQLNGGRNSQVDMALTIIKEIGGNVGLAIGVEDFILRSSNQSRTILEPVRWTHALEFGLWKGIKEYDGIVRRRQYFLQTPADAKTRFTDDRLRIEGLYTPGPDHIRDSTRHALLFLLKLRAREAQTPGYFTQVFGNEEGWYE